MASKQVVNMDYETFLKKAKEYYDDPEDTSRYLCIFEWRKRFVLNAMDFDDVRRLFEDYLFKWGKMARVYPISIREKIYKKFLEEVRRIASEIDALTNLTLIFPEFDKYEDKIKRVYEEICEINVPYKDKKPRIAPTSTSKILHFLQPTLFIIWDRKNVREPKHYGETSDWYLRYLRNKREDLQTILDSYMKTNDGSKIEALRAIEDLHAEDLAKMGYQGKESITKMLDEVNYDN